MKNNKKIIIIILVVIIISIIVVIGLNSKNKNESNSEANTTSVLSEALEFKNEYEKLNDTETSSGNKVRSVTISEDNPFIKATGDEIVEKINNNESFYLYIGDPKCPWCRSVIEKFIEMANKNNIKEVYYINIWDDDHNEIFRDKYELDEDSKPVKTIDGTSAYYTLLDKFASVLDEYELTTSDGKKVDTKEKRIYAPNFFYVKDGKIKSFTSGLSNKQTGAYDELTDEILTDEEKLFTKFIENAE